MFEFGKDLLNRIEVGAVVPQEAEASMFPHINGVYNPSRRHSALGGKSPLAIRSPRSLNEKSERLKNATGPQLADYSKECSLERSQSHHHPPQPPPDHFKGAKGTINRLRCKVGRRQRLRMGNSACARNRAFIFLHNFASLSRRSPPTPRASHPRISLKNSDSDSTPDTPRAAWQKLPCGTTVV